MFVAIRPPEAALEHLDDFLDVRREAAPFRWTLIEQVHLTLAFLGRVPEGSVEELVERLGRAAAKRRGFVTRIHGGGAFPGPARARVLWAGLDLAEPEREELRRLSVGARSAAVKSGIEVDGQRFRPHLTVARLGTPVDVVRWVRILDSYRGPEWPVETISLIASHLGEGPRGRPRHDLVTTFPLTLP